MSIQTTAKWEATVEGRWDWLDWLDWLDAQKPGHTRRHRDCRATPKLHRLTFSKSPELSILPTASSGFSTILADSRQKLHPISTQRAPKGTRGTVFWWNVTEMCSLQYMKKYWSNFIPSSNMCSQATTSAKKLWMVSDTWSPSNVHVLSTARQTTSKLN